MADLPVVIIQQIQHHLDGKQAAQTVVLSKSWHAAWLTRSTLYFNVNCFLPKPVNNNVNNVPENFTRFAKQTIQRYKDAKLCVHKLVLIMINDESDTNKSTYAYSTVSNKDSYSTVLCDELITDALHMGAYEFVISFTKQGYYCYTRYDLPAQLFASTSLKLLDVSGCRINKGRVASERFQSLLLDRVSIKDEVLKDILLGCPWIESLELVYCGGLSTVNVSKMKNLVQLRVSGWIDVEFGDTEFGVDVAEFRNLRTLWFEMVELKEEFFRGFSSRFPRVHMLQLEGVPCEEFNISSDSLSHLRVIRCNKMKKMRFDVPNIVRFVYKGGYDIPLISSGTMWRHCVSYVQFAFSHDVIKDSWFVELRKLLTKLRRSRISLHVKLCGKCQVSAETLPCFPIPVVENLTVDTSQVSHTSSRTWRCLFWSCRPKFVTECKPSAWWGRGHDPFILSDLYQLLKRDENNELSRGDENKDSFYRVYKLEKVNLEVFDEDLVKWQTVPLDTLKKYGDENIRFRFSWAT